MAKATKTRKLRELELELLDRSIKASYIAPAPAHGWAKSIREAYGMTREQMARRMGVAPGTVADLERNEVSGSISLKNLSRLAKELGLQLHYAFLPPPGRTLESIVRDQAEKVARRRVERVSHTMALEKQDIDDERKKRQLRRTVDELLSGSRRNLWR